MVRTAVLGLGLVIILGVRAAPTSEPSPEFFIPADPGHVLLSYALEVGYGGRSEPHVRLFGDGSLEVIDRGRIFVGTMAYVELRDLLEDLWRCGVLTRDFAAAQERAQALLRTRPSPVVESDPSTAVLRIDVPGYRGPGAGTMAPLVREIRWKSVFLQAAELKELVPELQGLVEALREVDRLRSRGYLKLRSEP